MAQILFSNAEQIVTNSGVAKKGGVGVQPSDLGILEGSSLLWDSKKGVLWLGKKGEKPPRALSRKPKTVSLKGRILTPALVDCHTHLVFGGSRHSELEMRLDGKSYQQIAAAGGGIRSSVLATTEIDEKTLLKLSCNRVDAMAAFGVGILEIKSGYGLSLAVEQKQLRVIQKLKQKYQAKDEMLLQSTFLGAHAFPAGTKTDEDREKFVLSILEDMLPIVAKKKLADACDVFFDEGYFNESQTRRILNKAKSLGLKIKLHADELANTGGASLAAELGALSADHLLKADDQGLKEMAKSGVVAVLLPGTAFYLGLEYASIEKMRRNGVCVALATDYNPGSSPILSLPLILSIACLQNGMTMPEAFAAGTYGGARALGFSENHGHITVGKKPKLAVFGVGNYQELISNVGHSGLCELRL